MGFSRTSGLELFFFGPAFLEAWRMVVEAVEGVGTRARHIRPLWGKRNRGIDVVRDILKG